MILATIRGTGNVRGPFNGAFTGVVARAFQGKWDLHDVDYSASIGGIHAPGEPSLPLDDTVTQGVNDLVRLVQSTNDVVGLCSYSLGGIVAMRFLEGVADGRFRNVDGSRMEIAFHVGFASPSRREGDSIVPGVKGSGIHSSHGPLPPGLVNLELANPYDMITATGKYSPNRRISAALSPFAALEQARLGTFDAVTALKNVRSADFWSRITPGRYTEAAFELAGYLIPTPLTKVTQHTAYGTTLVPGTRLTWTNWAIDELHRRFA